TQDLVFVNGAVAGVTYTATVGGLAAGSVTNVEAISISGGSGNDHISAALTVTSPVTTFDGGSGQDVVELDASALTGAFSGGLNVLGAGLGGLFYINSGSALVSINNIEALNFKGNATGSVNGPGVTGGAGNDTPTGVAGNDTFTGGGGNDVIDGGAGTDLAIFNFSDRTQDLVFVNRAQAGVTYVATVGGAAAGSVANVEAISITGGSGNDHIGAVLTVT